MGRPKTINLPDGMGYDTFYRLKTHSRFTTDKQTAMDMAALTGEPAINFVKPGLRETFKRAWRELEWTPQV